MCILDFLNENSNALMVVITLAYVVATIAIWCTNRKSTEAMEKQLEESKRQFSETQRLSSLPFLSVSIGDIKCSKGERDYFPDLFLSLSEKENRGVWSSIDFGISIKNIGSGLACKLKTRWIADQINEDHSLPANVLCLGDDTTINVKITATNKDGLYSRKAKLVFCFSDVLGHEYEQALELSLSLTPCGADIVIASFSMHEPHEVYKD